MKPYRPIHRKILKEGAPELSQVAEDVEYKEDVANLIADMFDTMHHNSGIGLAANQIGVLKRIIVLKTSKGDVAVINPVIKARTGGPVHSSEGCLSFPGRTVRKRRYKRVVVVGFDENWFPIKLTLRGLDAFCGQHEIDHLHGVTIW